MKVYIVLQYADLEGITEFCRVDRVYTTRKRADKRKRLLDRTTIFSGYSYHVIEKTLKGKL